MAPNATGPVAIVTGAGRGLGRAMGKALASAGWNVVATASQSADELAALCGEHPGRIVSKIADVGKEDDCASLVDTTLERFGRIDAVVANAGIGMIHVREDYRIRPVRFWEVTGAQWRRTLDVNFSGPFYLASKAVPKMIAAGWGRIVVVGTGHGTMVRKGYSPYGPSKAGLEAAVSIWAKDLEGTGVTVNCLLPGGATDTAFMPADIRGKADGKLLDPAIMADPIVWLTSPAADGYNGRRIVARKWKDGLEASISDAGWGPGGQPPGSDAST